MKTKTFVKLIVAVVVLVGILAGGYYFFVLPKSDLDKSAQVISNELFGWKFPIAKFPATGSEGDLAYSSIRDPGGIPRGLPVRLKIPIIGVDTAIEDALITPDGRMDVPEGTVNVAWFALGPHPGNVGSAVIGGHYGIDNGRPKVFYRLDNLKVGDKVYIVNDKGETLAFIVRSIKLFNRDGDTTTVFTSHDGLAHLNLITCEGVWNQVNNTYPDRRVIFTDAIPAEEVVAVKPKAIVSPLPSLSPTAVPSETIMPLPVAFTSTPEPGEEIQLTSSPSPTPTIIESAGSLYATPEDAFVTSFLIISIILTVVGIVH